MKKSHIFFVILLITLLTTGCSQQAKQTQVPALAKKKLIVAMEPGYYPFEMMDLSGNLIGYDIDLARKLAEYLDMEVEFQGYSGITNMIAALQSQKADLIISGLLITDKRKETVDFSDIYFENDLSIAVNSKHKGLKKWEELDKPGNTIAVALGSLGDLAAQKMFRQATIKKFDGIALAGQAVISQQADAIISTDAWVKVYKIYNPDNINILVEKLDQPQLAGIAANKGNKELLDKVNAFLKQYKASGEQARNYEKWFKNDSWKDLVPPRK